MCLALLGFLGGASLLAGVAYLSIHGRWRIGPDKGPNRDLFGPNHGGGPPVDGPV